MNSKNNYDNERTKSVDISFPLTLLTKEQKEQIKNKFIQTLYDYGVPQDTCNVAFLTEWQIAYNNFMD